MAGQHVEFMKRAWIAEEVDALTGEQLALALVALDRAGASGVNRLLLTVPKVVNFVLHRKARGISHLRNASADGTSSPIWWPITPRLELRLWSQLGPRPWLRGQGW